MLDQARLARLVDRFYDKVRTDPMLGPVFGFAFMALGSQALNNENPLFIAFGVPVFGSLSGTVLTWLVMKFIRSSQKGPELPATEEAEAR